MNYSPLGKEVNNYIHQTYILPVIDDLKNVFGANLICLLLGGSLSRGEGSVLKFQNYRMRDI